jgi:hypothetical protein
LADDVAATDVVDVGVVAVVVVCDADVAGGVVVDVAALCGGLPRIKARTAARTTATAAAATQRTSPLGLAQAIAVCSCSDISLISTI